MLIRYCKLDVLNQKVVYFPSVMGARHSEQVVSRHTPWQAPGSSSSTWVSGLDVFCLETVPLSSLLLPCGLLCASGSLLLMKLTVLVDEGLRISPRPHHS